MGQADRSWRPTPEQIKRYYPDDPTPKTPIKNRNGMFEVEEVIHHGSYYSRRVVEVYDLTDQTMAGILMSSAYCYGPMTEEQRRKLMLDLKEGHVHRSIGWSTFRVL